jgi:hypothetical protein
VVALKQVLKRKECLRIRRDKRTSIQDFVSSLADFAGPIRLGEAERRQSCVYPRLVCGVVIRVDL